VGKSLKLTGSIKTEPAYDTCGGEEVIGDASAPGLPEVGIYHVGFGSSPHTKEGEKDG